MKESGYDQIPAYVWIGFFLPKGTPPEIAQKLNTVFNNVLTDKDVLARMDSLGVVARATTPEGFTDIISKDLVRLGEVVKNAGLKKS